MLSDLMTNSDSEVKLILGLFSPIWWCRDIQCSDILENDILENDTLAKRGNFMLTKRH